MSDKSEQSPANLFALLQQTQVLVSRCFDTVSGRFGLSYSQAAVLAVLRRQGEALPLSQIARQLTQEAQSTTELADRLESRGLVVRTRNPKDRRLVLLELTDKGIDTIDAILPMLHDSETSILGALSDKQHNSAMDVLIALRDRANLRLGEERERTKVK